MLKYKLENLDELEDEQKALYEEKDGVFYLKVDGMPEGEDVTGLKNKVDELLKEKKAEVEAKRLEEEKRRQAEEDAAKSKGDFEALSKSYEQKIEDLQRQLKEKDESIARKEIERKASLIAADLAEGPNQEILSTFIEKRLRVDGDEIKVTDENGNLTISTIDQLKEEFRNNKKFGALVVASKASGSGADGSSTGGGAATNNPFKKGDGFNLTEQARLWKENPTLAEQLKSQAG